MSNRNFHDGKREHAVALSNSQRAVSYKSIEVTPVNPVIGAAVSGVDMTRELPAAQVDDLNRALADHNVLFFRDQPELTTVPRRWAATRFSLTCTRPSMHYPNL